VGPARQGYTGGEMEISWKNDREYLYMALNGTAKGWLAIGFEPREWMKNADMILGYVQGGKAVVLDEYCTGNYGPHIEDTMLGGTDDILESAGSKTAGRTVIEFKRKLDTGDRFDKALSPGQAISVIWASSQGSDASVKHDVAYGEGILILTEEQMTGGAHMTALTLQEKEGLLFIWEEEKAARDLYNSLHEKNNLSIFLDLVRSEQSHMDQAKAIIDKYGLQAQIKDEPGVFENQTMQQIHDQLLEQGLKSDQDALQVAATFEEISITDLNKEIAVTQAEDIRVVYQGLLAGSRKHLRSYVSDLQDLGIQYSPVYLSSDEFDEIVKAQ